MDFDTHVPAPTIKVNGAPLLPTMAPNVARIVVEGQRNLPTMCEVEFQDDDTTIADNPMMRPGVTLKVESAPASEDPTQRSLGALFDGEIVAVEASFTPHGGKRLVLRAYDKSYRLHGQRRTKSYLMQSDSLIVQQVCSAAGVTAQVQATTTMHPYVLQHNQTDWEFVQQRARECGFEVGMNPLGMLSFRRSGPDPTAGVPQRLAFGANLLSFRTRVTSAEQAKATKAQAFNGELKQKVVGAALPVPPENTVNDPQLSPTMLGTRFGKDDQQSHVPFDLPLAATEHATARRTHKASASFEAEGRCIGNPAMRPGGKVSVSDVGKTFSGSYTLTTVRHVFDASGYVTEFTVSGSHDRSLLGLAQPGAATGLAGRDTGGRVYGLVVAQVTNSTDEKQLGRVKVKFPWLDDTEESSWAPVAMVGGGPGKGFQDVPEVGDTVLVGFEHGDMRRPYVLGGLYNLTDKPPAFPLTPPKIAGGKTNLRVYQTRAGHKLEFDDTTGTESITIQSKGGAKIVVTDAPQESIAITDKSGKNSITIDGAAQKVVINATADIQLKATANLKLEATGNMELKAMGQLKLEGTGGVDIKTPAMLNVEGATSTVKGNGQLTLRGGMVMIN